MGIVLTLCEWEPASLRCDCGEVLTDSRSQASAAVLCCTRCGQRVSRATFYEEILNHIGQLAPGLDNALLTGLVATYKEFLSPV